MELNVEYGDLKKINSEIWRLKKPQNIVSYLWLFGEICQNKKTQSLSCLSE
jgi:hypothetical protein